MPGPERGARKTALPRVCRNVPHRCCDNLTGHLGASRRRDVGLGLKETFGIHIPGSLHRGPPGAAQQLGWSGRWTCAMVTEALPSSLQTGVAVALSGSRSFVVEMALRTSFFFQNQPSSGLPCRSSLVAKGPVSWVPVLFGTSP